MDQDQARSRLLAERAEVTGLLADTSAAAQQDRAAESEVGDMADAAQPLTAEGMDQAVQDSLSDRLAALAGEIGKLGGEVTELPDGLRITPSPLRAGGVGFDSHDDHRLVMAAAVLGLVTDGLMVHNAATVGKTFPGFSQVWAQLLTPVQG